MPACIHDLRQPDRAQQRRLPALVGAGDDDRRRAVGGDVVPDDGAPGPYRQPDVVQALRRQPPPQRLRCRHREPEGSQPLLQCHAAHVEGHFATQLGEETEHLLGGLGQHVGHRGKPTLPQFCQGLAARGVGLRDCDRGVVGSLVTQPPPPRGLETVQHIPRSPARGTDPGSQYDVGGAQHVQVPLDDGEPGVGEGGGHLGNQGAHPLRAE